MMQSPYADLPPRAFWRQAVSERPPSDPGDIYTPRFPISTADKIMTAGSCFAQHVGRQLKRAGFTVLDVEPLPEKTDATVAARFGYGLFTARYGNIYTVRQLVQLIDEAYGRLQPADPVWEKDGLFFDAQRPNVEPDGLDSPETVMRLRLEHLAKVREALEQADVFVFTFGLTEAFVHTASGTVYPTAPGTIAGSYDPALHTFKNFGFAEVLADFLAFRDKLKAVNPGVRFLVTTSPVPLTATASGKHVEVATAYSKSVLRAVCGELYDTLDDVDYFPSYEIITSQRAGGAYYEANVRSVAAHGVATAMATFMNAHGVSTRLPGVMVGRLADLAVLAFGGDRTSDAARADDDGSRAARKAAKRAAKSAAATTETASDSRTERKRARKKATGEDVPERSADGAGASTERKAKRAAKRASRAGDATSDAPRTERRRRKADNDEAVCEEALLEAFAR